MVDSFFSSLWMCCGGVELSSHILYALRRMNYKLHTPNSICVCVCVCLEFSLHLSRLSFSFRIHSVLCEHKTLSIQLVLLSLAPNALHHQKWKRETHEKKRYEITPSLASIVGTLSCFIMNLELHMWKFVCVRVSLWTAQCHSQAMPHRAVPTLSHICLIQNEYLFGRKNREYVK